MKKNQILSLILVGTLLFGVTTATSDYMHYQAGTISICDPDSNGTKCITMQDKNLGASEAGVGCINYSNYCYAGVHDYEEDMEECLADDMSYLGCMGWEYFGELFEDEEDCNDRGESLYETCMAENGTGVYGNHYQRGNNYGFANPGVNGEDAITQAATNTLALWSPDNYNHVGYYGTTFIKGTSSSKYDYWSDNTPSNHNGLRGGENDTQENNYGYDETNNVARNVENRRGPCGEGYHVPSIGEWNQLLKYWADNNGIELQDNGEGLKYNYTTLDGLQFQEDFKIPFAGYRGSDDAKVNNVGNDADLWSSSPRVGYDYARDFDLYPYEANAYYYNVRAYAFSVRCFKNSYLSFPSSEGGSSTAQIILSVRKGTLTIGTTTGNLNLGEVNVSNNAQELSGSFGTNSFWVEDMKGSESGYYTTISVSNLTGTVPTHVISANNVYLKTAGNEPSYISGAIVSDSKVVFSNDIKLWHNNWAEPVTYFNRQDTATADAGRVGKWGDNLQIKVNIPAHTPSDTYRGTITYTLYDLDS